MAACQIRYNPDTDRRRTMPGPRLEDHFTAGQLKAMVQNGLDYSANTQHNTEVQWRAMPLPMEREAGSWKNARGDKERQKKVVQRVLEAQYGRNIMATTFRPIKAGETARITVQY